MPVIPPQPTNRSGVCNVHEHAVSRRMFLQGLAATGLAFGGFDAMFAPVHALEAKAKQKNVILIFMSGGASQFETWDPKPGEKTSGPHMTIQTGISGVRFDEFMPNLARLTNRMSVIRSLSTPSNDHVAAGLLSQSGFLPSPAIPTPPHWLAVCSHMLPCENDNGLPSYVMLSDDGRTFPTPGPGFLGAEYAPLVCAGDGKPPQDIPKEIEPEISALDRREGLRDRLSRRFHEGHPENLVETHEVAFRRMGALLRTHKAFDISKEPAKSHEKYGTSPLGKDLLLTRRLIEHGVPFIRVQHQRGGAWDKHRNAFRSQRYITSEFDHVVGALIEDLVERGLWDHTLVVCMGEFGRTPMINGQGGGGRDHWSKSWSMSLGGGGIKGGVVIGSTSKDGTEVKDRPISMPDLFCTLYKALGINPRHEILFQDRPIPLVETRKGHAIEELI